MRARLRKRFRAAVLGQVLLLGASVGMLAWTAVGTDYLAVPLVLGAAILLQVYALLHTVERHVDTLEDFFAAIRYEDLTRRYVVDGVDAELKAAFNRVIERFREARAERDLQAGYLESLVRHVPVPLMAVRADGTLRLGNGPLRRLTGLSAIRRLDDLAALDPALPDLLAAVGSGRRQLVQTRFGDVPVELRVAVSELRLDGETERIYSIENLSGELSARESSAWRNLIRVLTHEITNTLTPVASLADTALVLAREPKPGDELAECLSTIARRSRGLIGFVERYRELLRVPRPVFAAVNVRQALDGVALLMRDELEGIDVAVEVEPSSLTVQADPGLLDQVLVNLVRNAAQALHGRKVPTLVLRGRLEPGRTLIQVVDNGCGIASDIADQIFVPFFTTRRDGSGIGLSVSRQIMLAHGGSLVASSTPRGTTMSLVF